MKPETGEGKLGITALDMRIVISIGICYLTALLFDYFGLKFSFGEMRLEIIQKMTPCITCLLCCQDNTMISRKTGVTRLIVTALGGIAAIVVVCLDNVIGNQWIGIVLIMLGTLVTLLLCKLAKVPYISTRIGGVTFILVACTLPGYARIWYAIFRLLSTFYGVLVVLLVTWIFQLAAPKKNV